MKLVISLFLACVAVGAAAADQSEYLDSREALLPIAHSIDATESDAKAAQAKLDALTLDFIGRHQPVSLPPRSCTLHWTECKDLRLQAYVISYGHASDSLTNHIVVEGNILSQSISNIVRRQWFTVHGIDVAFNAIQERNAPVPWPAIQAQASVTVTAYPVQYSTNLSGPWVDVQPGWSMTLATTNAAAMFFRQRPLTMVPNRE